VARGSEIASRPIRSHPGVYGPTSHIPRMVVGGLAWYLDFLTSLHRRRPCARAPTSWTVTRRGSRVGGW
jgi:hypothetical protein